MAPPHRFFAVELPRLSGVLVQLGTVQYFFNMDTLGLQIVQKAQQVDYLVELTGAQIEKLTEAFERRLRQTVGSRAS